MLHATLPTQILTGLPVHVDASFFPRLDRKGILLDGHEGDWNRAAIDCAAELVADNLERLAHALGAKPFWRLVRAAYDGRNRERRGASDSLGVFWEAIRRQLPDARVMPTASGEWAAVNETVLPARTDPPEWLALLEEIGIHTVAEASAQADRRHATCNSHSDADPRPARGGSTSTLASGEDRLSLRSSRRA